MTKRTDKIALMSSVIFISFILIGQFSVALQNQQYNESFGFKGHINAWIIKEDGTKIQVLDIDNVITNAFKDSVRGQIFNANISTFQYIRIGNSTGGDATSTNLVNPINTTLASYTTPASYQARLSATFTFTTWSGQTITEAGVVNWMHETTGGTLVNYQSFTGIVCTSTDILEVQITFTVS